MQTLTCTIRPIQSYRSQGVSKEGVDPSHHAIVHTTRSEPDPLASEVRRGLDEQMRPSIRVSPDDPQDRLGPESRINYSEVYTVQYNAKVKALGNIHESSTEDFDRACWQILGDICFTAVTAAFSQSLSRMQTLRDALQAAQAQEEDEEEEEEVEVTAPAPAAAPTVSRGGPTGRPNYTLTELDFSSDD